MVTVFDTVKVYVDNLQDVALVEEILQQRGYEPVCQNLWRQLLPTPARAIAESAALARMLRRRGYRVISRLV
jgi:predicted DCC family thiol-disulfide oxidoreductase YuxK